MGRRRGRRKCIYLWSQRLIGVLSLDFSQEVAEAVSIHSTPHCLLWHRLLVEPLSKTQSSATVCRSCNLQWSYVQALPFLGTASLTDRTSYKPCAPSDCSKGLSLLWCPGAEADPHCNSSMHLWCDGVLPPSVSPFLREVFKAFLHPTEWERGKNGATYSIVRTWLCEEGTESQIQMGGHVCFWGYWVS